MITESGVPNRGKQMGNGEPKSKLIFLSIYLKK